jgi:hypothetical protein
MGKSQSVGRDEGGGAVRGVPPLADCPVVGQRSAHVRHGRAKGRSDVRTPICLAAVERLRQGLILRRVQGWTPR